MILKLSILPPIRIVATRLFTSILPVGYSIFPVQNPKYLTDLSVLSKILNVSHLKEHKLNLYSRNKL